MRVQAIARWQVDVDRLPAAAQCATRDVEAICDTVYLHERRVVGGCETAIGPVVLDVPVRAEHAYGEEGGERGKRSPSPARRVEAKCGHPLVLGDRKSVV